ncbi:MAG TPA: tRNA (adenosine(37)-N6)-threonylcarbamoyltransferase complex transferase subunit TsaD [Actinomycetota bacterium]|nr:tRNA (adenosine(37)-N6)-threonylcarbamoyltransferase complex transferase subunit TsaD [Actinomycetota bacterium]
MSDEWSPREDVAGSFSSSADESVLTLPNPETVEQPIGEWDDNTLVLGIETSCDETSAAIVKGGREILSNVIVSQERLHGEYGGIVPEIAARAHVEALTPAIGEALLRADATFWDLDAVAATLGPGLIGSLLVGVAEAKSIAAVLELPFVGVNHLEAHIYSNLLAHPEAAFPAVALIISGGHTMLVHAYGPGTYELLGGTIDDAAGEAFDKVARFLGLEYPGGPEIDRLSLLGDPEAIQLPRALINEAGFDVSYSGLKTAVINHVRRSEARGEEVSVEDLAASFQRAVVEVQVTKTMAAVEHAQVERLFLCGGVAANSGLRQGLADAAAGAGVTLFVPPTELCTDNAAMVAACGMALLRRGSYLGLDATPDPNLPLI